MFHEKIGKASVQVGTCWPDSGSGGVADCMNWGTSYSRKPTPPGVTQPEQNTMYPWGPKLYPPPMPPSEQREAYPWQKDMKKLPNTPAPDMNRWQQQRSRLKLQEAAVHDEMHSPVGTEGPDQTSRRLPPRGPAKNRKVQLMRDKYVTMYQDKPELTETDMKTIRQAVSTVKTRPNSAKPMLFGDSSSNKENLYAKTYPSQYRRTPQPPGSRTGMRNGGESPSILRGTSQGSRNGMNGVPPRTQRTAWQDSCGGGNQMEQPEPYGAQPYTRDAMSPYRGASHTSNYGQREPTAPYAFNDGTGNGYTSGACTPSRFKNQQEPSAAYNYSANQTAATPTYSSRPAAYDQYAPPNGVNGYHGEANGYGGTVVNGYNADVTDQNGAWNDYNNTGNHHYDTHYDSGPTSYTNRVPQPPAPARDEYSTSKTDRNVTFSEKLDSSRWIKSNRYTPQPNSQASNYEDHRDVGTAGAIRVSVDCEPDTEVTVRVTPGSDGSDSKPILYKRSKTQYGGLRYKPPTVVQERLPWR